MELMNLALTSGTIHRTSINRITPTPTTARRMDESATVRTHLAVGITTYEEAPKTRRRTPRRRTTTRKRNWAECDKPQHIADESELD